MAVLKGTIPGLFVAASLMATPSAYAKQGDVATQPSEGTVRPVMIDIKTDPTLPMAERRKMEKTFRDRILAPRK